MKGKRLLALLLAGMMLLAGCRSGKETPLPPEGESLFPGAVEEGAPEAPSSAPAESEKELPKVDVPKVYFPVVEYHNDLRENDTPDLCRVVIPRLEVYPQEMRYGPPDLTEANAPLEELEGVWLEFRDSQGHRYDGTMNVTSYPYTNGRWVQVVVHSIQAPVYNDEERLFSVNYDKEQARAVTAEEQLARLGLTPAGLLEKLNECDIPAALYLETEAKAEAKGLSVPAFRGREDGSAVFFVQADLAVELPGGIRESRKEFLAYDTRGEEFVLWESRLGRGEEQPNAISLYYGCEDYPKGREEYPVEPRPAPPAEVKVGFALREYHDVGCMAEIPRLWGYREGQEIPGLREANAPLRELLREWKEFRASPEHQQSAAGDHRENSLSVASYPYCDDRWVQVVVASDRIEAGEWSSRKIVSVNWDLEEGRAVSLEEMLERQGLTENTLLDRVIQVEVARVVNNPGTIVYVPMSVSAEAFRGREDGSAVFYLEAQCEFQEDFYSGTERVKTSTGERTLQLAYDTRDNTFRNVPQDLLRKWENVELPNTDDLPLRWQEEVQSPMI